MVFSLILYVLVIFLSPYRQTYFILFNCCLIFRKIDVPGYLAIPYRWPLDVFNFRISKTLQWKGITKSVLVWACFSRTHTKKWKCWVLECARYKFSWCQTALQLNYTNLHTCQHYMKDQFSHQLANINNFLPCFPCIYILSPGLGVENPESRPMMTSYLHIFPYFRGV